jgi:hypothetical protein
MLKIFTLLAVLLFAAPAAALDMSRAPVSGNIELIAEQKCRMGAVEDVQKFVSNNSLPAYELKAEFIETFNSFINANRAANNLPPVSLDKFLIIDLKNGEWMVMYFYKGCIAENSMATISKELLGRILDKAKLAKDNFVVFGTGA